jgi:hypothetical protein
VDLPPSRDTKDRFILLVVNECPKTREPHPNVPRVPHPLRATFSHLLYLDANASDVDKWQCFGRPRVWRFDLSRRLQAALMIRVTYNLIKKYLGCGTPENRVAKRS